MRRLFTAMLTMVLMLWPVAAWGADTLMPSIQAGQPDKIVAITTFTAANNVVRFGWMGKAMQEEMVSSITGIPGIKPAMLSEVPLDAARGDGVTWTVRGTYEIMDPNVRIIAQLVDVQSGSVIGSARITGEIRDFFGLADALDGQVRQLVIQQVQPSAATPPPATQNAPVPAAIDNNPNTNPLVTNDYSNTPPVENTPLYTTNNYLSYSPYPDYWYYPDGYWPYPSYLGYDNGWWPYWGGVGYGDYWPSYGVAIGYGHGYDHSHHGGDDHMGGNHDWAGHGWNGHDGGIHGSGANLHANLSVNGRMIASNGPAFSSTHSFSGGVSAAQYTRSYNTNRFTGTSYRPAGSFTSSARSSYGGHAYSNMAYSRGYDRPSYGRGYSRGYSPSYNYSGSRGYNNGGYRGGGNSSGRSSGGGRGGGGHR